MVVESNVSTMFQFHASPALRCAAFFLLGSSAATLPAADAIETFGGDLAGTRVMAASREAELAIKKFR